ncbi:hypothetical protein C8T65DRAFT_827067, partial [Cerioporus squamosus]
MSSDANAAAAATVVLFNDIYTGNYYTVAASVVFIYDAFITFDQEVAYFWTAKCTSGASLLFFANRWTSMVLYVMRLIEFASFPLDKSCSLLIFVTKAIAILQMVPAAAFSALRAYVLS